MHEEYEQKHQKLLPRRNLPQPLKNAKGFEVFWMTHHARHLFPGRVSLRGVRDEVISSGQAPDQHHGIASSRTPRNDNFGYV